MTDSPKDAEIARIVAGLTKAQRRVFTSRKIPSDYRGEDVAAFYRLGLVCFPPAGGVITTPAGLQARAHIIREGETHAQ